MSMIIIDHPCEQCSHFIGMLKNGEYACDAFPTGYSMEFLRKIYKEVDVRALPECGNGYKWTPKDDTTE